MPSQELQTPQTATPTKAPTTAPAKAEPDAQDQLGNAAVQQQLSVGQLTWRGAMGEYLGDKLYNAISDKLNDAELISVAQKAVGSATGKLGDYLKGQVDASEQDAAAMFVKALDGEVKRIAGNAVTGGLGDALRGFVDDNPYVIASAAVAGAAAYVMTNQDLPLIKQTLKLGGGHSLEAGIDPGRTLDLALEQVRVGYRYSNGGTQASVVGDAFVKEGGWQVKGQFSQVLDPQELVTLEGLHVDRPGENRSRLDLGYKNGPFSAGAYAERMRGDKTVDAFGARANYQQDDLSAHVRGETRSDGSWEAAGGLTKEMRDNGSMTVEGYGGQNPAGKADYGVRAMFRWTF